MHELVIPVVIRGGSGCVRVSLAANDDPRAYGCDLLYEEASPVAAVGFPVCEAVVELPLKGYAAACGWIQLIRTTQNPDEFQVDPLALLRDVQTPFAFFGIAPTLFDAPHNDRRYDWHFSARSFLCVAPDAVVSRVVHPIAGFSWGFDVVDSDITIRAPQLIELSMWNSHLPVMGRDYPTWEFQRVNRNE